MGWAVGGPWGDHGGTLGDPGGHWGDPVGPWGHPGRTLGWGTLGGTSFGGPNVPQVLCLPTKISKSIPSLDSGDSGDPGDPSHGPLLSTTPTRAGGQDDVSFNNKLPQINACKNLPPVQLY